MNAPHECSEILEILTLDIKPGRRDEFHDIYVTEALPLLRKWNFQVVAHGPSLHDSSSYYIIRRFRSLQHRREAEDAYYNSDDWKTGPRAAILERVEHFAYTVVAANTWSMVCRDLQNTKSESP